MTEERQLCGCGGYVPCGRNQAYCASIAKDREMAARQVENEERWRASCAREAEQRRERQATLRLEKLQRRKPKLEHYVEVPDRREQEYHEQVMKAWHGGNLGSQMTMHAGSLPSLEQYERAPVSQAARYYWKSRNAHDAWRKTQQRAYA